MGHQYMKVLCKTLKQFCDKTSLTGFRYFVDSRNTYLERCTWFLLECFLFVATIIMILDIIEDTVQQPLVTSLDSVRYHIGNIAFPGISVCNINKISKKRAIDYARLISDRGNLPFDDILKRMKIMGTFYDYEIDEGTVNEFLMFQTYLEQYGMIDNSSSEYYLYDIMKNLTTPCDELLHKCVWKGKVQKCSELFLLRLTYEGFCCTFNYVRRAFKKNSLQFIKTPEHLSSSGKDMGLTVILRNEPDDYFYPLISSVGINVHIFTPSDYPDDTSGGLIQVLVGTGTESFLDLNAKTIYSVPDVQAYPINVRNCIFPSEVVTAFGIYSFSNCLVACRIKSIIALCNCVPVIIPWYPNASVCTLPDLPCLNKYQGKWQNIFPTGSELDELEHEKQNSLQCDHCKAVCSGTQYTVSTNFAPLHLGNAKRLHPHENFSVINIYYGRPHTKLFKQEVVSYWFEVLSNIGGVLGIFLGISLMSLMEFLYFIITYFILILKRSNS